MVLCDIQVAEGSPSPSWRHVRQLVFEQGGAHPPTHIMSQLVASSLDGSHDTNTSWDGVADTSLNKSGSSGGMGGAAASTVQLHSLLQQVLEEQHLEQHLSV